MRIKLCRVCGLKQKRYENVAEEIYEMVIIIESLIGILLFTILIVPLTLKNRLTSVGDYPPAIREKCMELGLIEKREQRFTRADILRKGIALLAFVFIFAVVLKQFNGADTFWKGFRDAYLIWLTIDWYASWPASLPCSGNNHSNPLISQQKNLGRGVLPKIQTRGFGP